MIPISDMIKITESVPVPLAATIGDTWNALIGDRIATWRVKNAIDLHQKINALCERRGIKINTQKIPERYAVAWFEQATQQDESEIQDLFARLILEASEENECALDRNLYEIVGKMNSSDAKVFRTILGEAAQVAGTCRISPQSPSSFNIEDKIISQSSEKLGFDVSISLERIINLGLVERFRFPPSRSLRSAVTFNSPDFDPEEGLEYGTYLLITGMGLILARAVKIWEID